VQQMMPLDPGEIEREIGGERGKGRRKERKEE
jgi:hypothetical protein